MWWTKKTQKVMGGSPGQFIGLNESSPLENMPRRYDELRARQVTSATPLEAQMQQSRARNDAMRKILQDYKPMQLKEILDGLKKAEDPQEKVKENMKKKVVDQRMINPRSLSASLSASFDTDFVSSTMTRIMWEGLF